MDIKRLKKEILNKTLNDDLIIFEVKDDSSYFVVNQYIKEISNFKNLEISYENNIQNISNSLFNVDSSLVVCDLRGDKTGVTEISDSISNIKNTVIIMDNIPTKIWNIFESQIVVVPKLENWQIQDYVYSRLNGVKKEELDKFIINYNYNIQDLENEINKISIFDEKSRDFYFRSFIEEGLFDKFNQFTLFDLSNAITSRNIDKVAQIISSNTKIELIPLIGLLYNNFKNIINIQLDKYSSFQSLGMSQKQYNAIKYYNCNKYSKEELFKILKLLDSIDNKLKKGEIQEDIIFNYILIYILGDNK